MKEQHKKITVFGVFAVIGYLLFGFYKSRQEVSQLKIAALTKPAMEEEKEVKQVEDEIPTEESGGGGGGSFSGYVPVEPMLTTPVVYVTPIGYRSMSNYGRVSSAFGPNSPKMRVVDRKVKNIVKGYEPPVSGLSTNVTSTAPATPVSVNATSANLAPAAVETPKNAALSAAVASPVMTGANSVTANATGSQWAFDCGCN